MDESQNPLKSQAKAKGADNQGQMDDKRQMNVATNTETTKSPYATTSAEKVGTVFWDKCKTEAERSENSHSRQATRKETQGEMLGDK